MELFQVVLQVLCILPSILAQEQDCVGFPPNLTIGAASSAYQIEGGWNASDKGISSWDWIAHQEPSLIADGSTGDIACDSYHKYKEDVALAKNIGLDHYRFSLSWARILPTGYSNEISKDGIQYYKNLIDELRSKGIEPFVSLYFWDHPESMDRFGSWTNELMVDYFAEYARIVFRELGDRVTFWTTMNQISYYCSVNYVIKSIEQGLNLPPRAQYLCVHNMLKAHAKAYHIYNNEFRAQQKGQIGLATSCSHAYPVDGDDESSRIAFDFDCGWATHPIFSPDGDYPPIMKRRIAENSEAEGLQHSRLPEFSEDWINYIKGSSDYFGITHSTSYMVKSVPKINGTYWHEDSGLEIFQNTSWPTTSFDILRIKPDGIRQTLKDVKNAYPNTPIYILENGVALPTGINDTERISFLYSYMKQVFLAAQVDGVDVRGYTVYTLLDSFQFRQGYKIPFGLVHVDFNHPNRTRTMKLSSKWLSDVIRKKELCTYNDATLYENSSE